jgi:predicted nucleic acid-binding protein
MNQTFVLDANALLNLLMNAPGARRVEQLILEAHRLNTPLLVSVANWGEVFYLSWQRHGEQVARETMANLSRLPIEIVPLDLSQAIKAGELKARHHIPYVDCLAAALAALQLGTLVTSDRDFKKLGRHFPILWIAHA